MAEYSEPSVETTEPTEPAVKGAYKGKKKTGKPVGVQDANIVASLKGRLTAAKNNKRNNFLPRWKRNIEMRLARVGQGALQTVPLDADIMQPLNPNWALAKTKTANLWSRIPRIQGTHENSQYAAAVTPLVKTVNYEMSDRRANVNAAMREVVNDVVDASAIGAIYVGYAARFDEPRPEPVDDVTGIDPEVVKQGMLDGTIQFELVPPVADYKFVGRRISPSDLVWPAEFQGSDFNQADFLGEDCEGSWAEVSAELGLKDGVREATINASYKAEEDDMRVNDEARQNLGDLQRVRYTRLFYWRHRIDPNEKSFSCIWEIVFVEGMEKPAKHEQYKGQRLVPGTHKYVGVTRLPIKVLTTTYVSDNPVSMSDSEAGLPQVLDLQRSREHFFKARQRSTPLRWYDSNRLGADTQISLMNGEIDAFIPTNGEGTRSIGEISRASYPAEDRSFDQQTMADLMAVWMIGPNQAGSVAAGAHTAKEAELTQAGFNTTIGAEQSQVAALFVEVATAFAGLIALYSDFPNLSEQERTQMQQAWDGRQVTTDLVLNIQPGSTVLVSPADRYAQLSNHLNLVGQSGLIDTTPIIAEMNELVQLDNTLVMQKPAEKGPAEANLSFRFSGKEDLYNPMVLAFLQHTKQAPTAEEIKQAQELLKMMTASTLTGESMPVDPAAEPPEGSIPNPQDGPANPDWTLTDKIAKRGRDMEA